MLKLQSYVRFVFRWLHWSVGEYESLSVYEKIGFHKGVVFLLLYKKMLPLARIFCFIEFLNFFSLVVLKIVLQAYNLKNYFCVTSLVGTTDLILQILKTILFLTDYVFFNSITPKLAFGKLFSKQIGLLIIKKTHH
jgi:hypothetical protein